MNRVLIHHRHKLVATTLDLTARYIAYPSPDQLHCRHNTSTMATESTSNTSIDVLSKLIADHGDKSSRILDVISGFQELKESFTPTKAEAEEMFRCIRERNLHLTIPLAGTASP